METRASLVILYLVQLRGREEERSAKEGRQSIRGMLVVDELEIDEPVVLDGRGWIGLRSNAPLER